MTMTMRAVNAQIVAAPERAHILVYEDGDQFVAAYEGQEFRAGNPFGLDSELTAGGVPAPRNLYLVDRIEALEADPAERSQGDRREAAEALRELGHEIEHQDQTNRTQEEK